MFSGCDLPDFFFFFFCLFVCLFVFCCLSDVVAQSSSRKLHIFSFSFFKPGQEIVCVLLRGREQGRLVCVCVCVC